MCDSLGNFHKLLGNVHIKTSEERSNDITGCVLILGTASLINVQLLTSTSFKTEKISVECVGTWFE